MWNAGRLTDGDSSRKGCSALTVQTPEVGQERIALTGRTIKLAVQPAELLLKFPVGYCRYGEYLSIGPPGMPTVSVDRCSC